MRFSVPGVPDEEAAARQNTRPLCSITYEDDGTEVVVSVGEEGVVAIIAGLPTLYIFEGLEDWTLVPVESVTEMTFFED